MTVTHEDILQFNISTIFDVSTAVDPVCDVKASAAEYFDYNTSLATKNLSDYHFGDQPEVVNMVSNSTVYAIYDNNRILIQDLNLDHLSFGELTVVDFGRPGTDAICTDLNLYERTDTLYITCFTNVSQRENRNMFLLTVNSIDGKIKKTYKRPIDEDHPAIHRLQVQIVPVKTGKDL